MMMMLVCSQNNMQMQTYECVFLSGPKTKNQERDARVVLNCILARLLFPAQQPPLIQIRQTQNLYPLFKRLPLSSLTVQATTQPTQPTPVTTQGPWQQWTANPVPSSCLDSQW